MEFYGFIGFIVTVFMIIWMAVVAARLRDIRDDLRTAIKWMSHIAANLEKGRGADNQIQPVVPRHDSSVDIAKTADSKKSRYIATIFASIIILVGAVLWIYFLIINAK